MKPGVLDDYYSNNEELGNNRQTLPQPGDSSFVAPKGLCLIIRLENINQDKIDKIITIIDSSRYTNDYIIDENKHKILIINIENSITLKSLYRLMNIVEVLYNQEPLDVTLGYRSDNFKPILKIRFFEGYSKRNDFSYKIRQIYNVIAREPSCLHIINVSSSINISTNITRYLDVISSPLNFLDACKSEDYPVLLFNNYNYPILLKEPNDMPTYEEMWDIEREQYNDYLPPEGTTVLGYYTREDENGVKGPHIVLCPESIERTARNGLKAEILYCIVYIHELAHALMDKYEEYSYIISDDELTIEKNNSKANWPKSIDAIAMEESLANMIMLQLFKLTPHYDLALDFVKNQAAFYKFGIIQEKANVSWKKWCSSSKQNTNELMDWFNKCFAHGSISIPIEDYNKEMFDKVFE